MARKRSIDPDLWTDDRVQALPSPIAILLYIGTISQADDEGRLEWSARQLLGRVFPMREDIKQRDVEAAMAAIVETGLVRTYVVGVRTYAVHPAWRKHQYVNRPAPSKIPAPPLLESEIEDAELTRDKASRKARISDIVKQQVAIRYGCEPGREISAMCACGEPGKIIWTRRKDGRPSSWVALEGLEWDHIVQEVHGGETSAANLQLSCLPCNRKRNSPAGNSGDYRDAPRGADVKPPASSESESESESESGLHPTGGAAGADVGAKREPNPPWDLASWLFSEALDLGLYADDSKREIVCRADLKAAKELLDAHPRREIAKRAKRLLRGVVEGERVSFSVRSLLKAWDYSFVASDNAKARAPGKPTEKRAALLSEITLR